LTVDVTQPQAGIGLNIDAPEHGGSGETPDWPEEVTELSGSTVLLFIMALLLYAFCGGGQSSSEDEGSGQGSGIGSVAAGLLAEFLQDQNQRSGYGSMGSSPFPFLSGRDAQDASQGK
jgi:hypothetical protein